MQIPKDCPGISVGGELFVRLSDAAKLREGWDKADERISQLEKATLSAYQEGFSKAVKIVTKRAAARNKEVESCLSARSKKHMQIRADEVGQIVALMRDTLAKGAKT